MTSTSGRGIGGATTVRRARGQAGSATASFVILFPVLIVMFMALVQWGLYFHAQSLVDAAAQDGARAAQGTDGTADGGRQIAAALLSDASGSGLISDVAIDITEESGVVHATVTGEVASLVPFPGFDLRVEGRASGPREVFVAEGTR